MLKLGKKISSLAIGGMLLAGSVAGVAFADANTQSTPDQSRDQFYQEFISDFAKNLGVSEDQVTAALEATKKQMVQEAVQQGKMTQTQADEILAQKGFGFGFGMGGPRHGRGDITQDTNFLNDAAGALGITPDALKSELQSGKKLDQIVTEHGMTMEQFRQKMPKPQQPPIKG
ncbi:Fis family transcriptional regulator [Desulforamulus putei]|nr:Fis family transcriptional regulator [Desulforamulus putei]